MRDHKNKQQPKKNNESLRSWLMIVLQMSALGIIICAGFWGWLKITAPGALPLKHVKVITTNNHIEANLLKSIVEHNAQGGFFSLNVNRLKQAVKKIPWVGQVEVRRVWPDRLVVRVQERKPLARWGTAGVIDQQGNVFYPDIQTIPRALPQLAGPPESEPDVAEQYQWMNQQLKPLHLQVVGLVLSPRLAWQANLSNHLTVLLGREDTHARFIRFVHLYSQVIGTRVGEVERVDLRYPNGLAIKWKHG